MAELTTRRRGEILRAAFGVLMSHPDGLQAKTVIEQMEHSLTLSPFELSTYPKNPKVRRFDKIVRFTTISSVKGGWLIKEKGQWSLTEEGRQAYKRGVTILLGLGYCRKLLGLAEAFEVRLRGSPDGGW